MYMLFPKIKNGLTNITITNAETAQEYIAYFQPLYQFVNINSNIDEFNKINKTQILLNSYYFLNSEFTEKSIDNIVEQGWYVPDATLESTIAHELGHFISFKLLLKEHNLDNVTFVTSNNEEKINDIIDIFNKGTYSYAILTKSLDNYNAKYNLNLSLEEFTQTISKYASSKKQNGEIIADEAIAEAIHDYYLHGNNMKNSSSEVINIILEKMETW